MRLFASLSKVEDQDDGSIKVHGIASSGARDDAGEIITPEAMKAALPDYLKWGAIREMHGPSAAGTAVEMDVDADGFTQLIAHVVDPVAISKVKAGVYKGFSIGGKVLARDPTDRTIITKIRLVETSLVDRPCNPEAAISMWKADVADPLGDDMTDQAEAVAAQPSNEAVKALAAELAKAAGKADRPQDFLVKAREELVAKAAEVVAEPEVPVTTDGSTADQPVAKAAAPAVEPAAVDPVAALAAVLERAVKSAAVVDEAINPRVTAGLSDFGKGLAKLGELYAEDPLRKGMYMLGALAEAINQLCGVQSIAASEAVYSRGGADMEAPQMLAEVCQNAGQALLQYAKESLAIMLAEMQAGGAELDVVVVDGDEAIALAAAAVDMVKADTVLMEKAGKRNSAADANRIQAMHDHSAKLGASCDPGNCPEAAKTAAAALQADNDRLSKALTDTVPQLESIIKRMDEQAEEIVKLKAQPMPPKAAASALVEKVVDAGGTDTVATGEALTKALAAMTEEERALALTKAALKLPQAIGR